MDRVILRARSREATGSRAARRIRRTNAIPAIVYGAHEEPHPIQIDLQEFETLMRSGLSETTLINLLLDDETSSERLTLIREVERDPVRDTLRHIDLLHIDLKERIRVEVPLHLTGSPEGVKQGGVLEQRIHAVEIECLPADIPSSFEVDVSHLAMGDAIHLHEIDLGGLETHMNLERTIAKVAPPRIIEVEAPVEEVIAEPVVVGEEEAEEEERDRKGEGDRDAG